MRAIAVRDESQVAEARRGAVTLAQGLGFGEEDAGRVAIVATELATNLIKHGGGGELLVATYDDRTGSGVECLALDKGRGMADVEVSLRDGHSTAGSAGAGLGAIARGSHLVDIYSRPGLGTAVLVRLQKGRPANAKPSPEPVSGVVGLPKPGEEACGDAWCVKAHARGFKLMVADGLGHGPTAAKAAHAAVRVFLADHARPPGEILERMHAALRPTRGAAVAVADVDIGRGAVVFSGIGNVAGVLVADARARRMVSHNGTVGHIAKRVQEFTYPFEGVPLVILCSDRHRHELEPRPLSGSVTASPDPHRRRALPRLQPRPRRCHRARRPRRRRMSSWTILTVAIEREADVVAARQRARRIAELLGFEAQDQTRIATAVSEIVRNAAGYGGGGRAEFALSGPDAPQRLVIRVSDKGPGIGDLDSILAGQFESPTGLGLGIVGARRLMDRFGIESAAGRGTVVTLEKQLPRAQAAVAQPALVDIARRLAAEAAGDPIAEVRAQNRELLRSLDELSGKHEETARLNEELERTNRGVVALYAELDHKAVELEKLNAGLEERIATAVADRERAEESLRHSQKMEAIGQLTGGIAHDFNNLLQIVTGNLEILERNLPEDAGRLRRAAENARRGAERAAILTQRLLAFSRRQPLTPKTIDVNALVASMSDLLRRTLGEQVEIETVLAGGLWRVEADPHQLENALLNLAVNARDAMPDGGKLTIETANTHLDGAYARENIEVAPGQYVAVCVTDTGAGMSKETVARAFEPFFTTKEVGRGTGLGLSMVYGFVKQSGGNVKLYSEEGEGTTVKIYLPRLFGALEEEEAAVPDAPIPEGREEEVILVVEDDDDVRAYSVEVLRELGYKVLEAQDAASALRVLERQDRLDLLFTDIVLPGGATGRQLADAALAQRPELRVLFTTGYARNAIVHNGRLDPDVEMIGKPFTFSDLAARVRDVLDAKPKVRPDR